MASGHSNTGKGNDLLTNNVNNTEIDWNKYGNGGVTAKLQITGDTVLGKQEQNRVVVFITYTQG